MCFKAILRRMYGSDNCVYLYEFLEKITSIYYEKHLKYCDGIKLVVEVNDVEFQNLGYKKEELKVLLSSLKSQGFISNGNAYADYKPPYTVNLEKTIPRLADFQLDRRRHKEVQWLQIFTSILTVFIAVLSLK